MTEQTTEKIRNIILDAIATALKANGFNPTSNFNFERKYQTEGTALEAALKIEELIRKDNIYE